VVINHIRFGRVDVVVDQLLHGIDNPPGRIR
jgi:hypothetical protein